jgi:hypothetical protein
MASARFAVPRPGRILHLDGSDPSNEVNGMQSQSLLQAGSRARLLALSLLVAVVLVVGLVLAQLATRPAPDPAPKPPMQFGSSTGRPMPQ